MGATPRTADTQLAAGAMAIDLTTSLELGADMLPLTSSAKGTAQGQTLEQSANTRTEPQR